MTWLLLAAAFAAQERPVLELSLRQAVDIALAPEGAARVQLAREAIAAAETRSRQAKSALLPQLDGGYQYANQTRNLLAFGINVRVPGFSFPSFAGPFNVNDARANISQSIVDLAAWKRFEASRAAIQQVRLESDAVRLSTADVVARAYLAALRAQAHIDAQNANLQLAEAVVRLARNQKDAGTGTGIDLTRARVQLANERQRLIVATNDFDRASLALLRAMNAGLDARLKLTDTLSLNEIDTSRAEELIRNARASRPDLKAQQQRHVVAGMTRQSVDRERLPVVGAAGDYGVIGPTFANNAFPTRAVGLAVRVPLWDGGRRNARRAEAAIAQRQEAIRALDMEKQAELEVRLALESLESAKAQVAAATEGLALAENEVAQAQRRFEAGFANSLEVVDAQTRLARARDNRIAALFLHNVARLDLQTATGQLP